MILNGTKQYRFIATTFIAAIVAAFAASASLSLSFPVWVMFIGWIAFYTRNLSLRGAAENLACVGVGIVFGALAVNSINLLLPLMGIKLALPSVVFISALIVVSLRGLNIMNNLVCYFLGMVAWFAAHLEPSLKHVIELFSASTLGVLAGLISYWLPARLFHS